MRLRIALDVAEIKDPEVREAVNEFLGLEDDVMGLDNEKEQTDAARLDTLLQKSKSAQEKISGAIKKLSSQYSAVSNAVLGYQAASLRSSDTNKYKASFIRALSGVTEGIKQATAVICPKEAQSSEKTARIARALFLAQAPQEGKELDFLEQQVGKINHKAEATEQLLERNTKLIDELTDIMKALGVGDISSPPQAPEGPVVPTPVPESPAAFQQPTTQPQGEPEEVETPR
jgi:hypothetical protein